jgi:hypothetical protein
MKLPNGKQAFIDVTKVRDYALNPTHPEGKHKARVFAAALGIGASHTEWLIGELRKAALDTDCIGGRQDEHGQRYIVEFAATRHGKTARLRSVWILRPTENSPRLVSCYVLV